MAIDQARALAGNRGRLLAHAYFRPSWPPVATYEGAAFAGTCAPFFARHKGQACPEPLSHYDDSDDECDWGLPGNYPGEVYSAAP
jgi:hypothetical protein